MGKKLLSLLVALLLAACGFPTSPVKSNPSPTLTVKAPVVSPLPVAPRTPSPVATFAPYQNPLSKTVPTQEESSCLNKAIDEVSGKRYSSDKWGVWDTNKFLEYTTGAGTYRFFLKEKRIIVFLFQDENATLVDARDFVEGSGFNFLLLPSMRSPQRQGPLPIGLCNGKYWVNEEFVNRIFNLPTPTPRPRTPVPTPVNGSGA